MLERIILIVDDNPHIEDVYIPAYLSDIEALKKNSDKWKDYSFRFIHKLSMKEALLYLSDVNNCVDVLVVDYNFHNDKMFTSGTGFVKHVREHINRFCQIVFYTMQGIGSIEKDELIDLVNSDVYRLVDKSKDNSELARVLFEAATQRNPIVESLEHFYYKYSSLLQAYEYTIGGEFVSFEEIINHIRMDDSKGRAFISKLLQRAILLNTDI